MLSLKTRVVINLSPLRERWLKKRRKVLFRTGGYALRVYIRQPIRSAKGSAPKGAVPKSHTRALKKNSAFEVDAQAGELLVGFTSFPSAVAKPLGGATVPSALFKGGRVQIDSPALTVTRPDGRQRSIAPQTVVATYEPRPALLDDAQQKAAEKALENVRQIPL